MGLIYETKNVFQNEALGERERKKTVLLKGR